MSRQKGSYLIPLQSLKEGIHEMTFKLGKEFIDVQNVEGMLDANLTVKIEFTKRATVHSLHLLLKGTVEVECDRCLDPLKLTIKHDQTFAVKVEVPNDEFSNSEDVILLSPDDINIDLTHILYESILLSLPMKKVHEEKKCNSTMLSFLEKDEPVEKKEKNDPRWDSLKNIFEN
jgi:uncharacterized metal-binding protein YceD (DUF177 family)